MWDPRYGDYAAEQLAQAWAHAASARQAAPRERASRAPARGRVAVGQLLVRVGERLVAQRAHPVRP